MKLKESGEAYGKKLENNGQENNVKSVWSEMKTITGFKTEGIQTEGEPGEGQ